MKGSITAIVKRSRVAGVLYRLQDAPQGQCIAHSWKLRSWVFGKVNQDVASRFPGR